MEISNIELQLKDILAHLDSDTSLLRLQEFLASQHNLKFALSNPTTRDLLNLISIHLKKHIMPANLFHSIQTYLARDSENAVNESKARSVHDIRGNLIWMDSKCESLFKLNFQRLKKSNLFQLMSQNSLNYLYMKHGQYIMGDGKPKVITYELQDTETTLTSRCSPLIFKDSAGNLTFGVLLESREARHKISDQPKENFKLSSAYRISRDMSSASPGFFYNIGLFSPSNSTPYEDSELFKRPNLSPNPTTGSNNCPNKMVPSSDISFGPGDIDNEIYSLTPLLANQMQLPTKRRRTNNIKITEFI